MERGVKTRLREISDQSGWDYDYKGDWYRFSKLSPEGQDFNIEIEASDLDMFKTELQNFHDNYNPDDEAVLWYGANKGEPKNLRKLLNDMEWCKNQVKRLIKQVNKLR